MKFDEKLFQTKLLSRLSLKVCCLLSSPVLLRKPTINCKGPQTNLPQSVGSKEDLTSKIYQSTHIEFCKADRTTV